MKKAFTMIEFIFVIIIIGILAVVAIPSFLGKRDDAMAKICEIEAAGLLQELTGYYAKNGYFDQLSTMSNLLTGVNGVRKKGIKEDGTTVPSVSQPITYICNGEDIVRYTPTQSIYTDAQGNVHDQFGIVTSDPGGANKCTGKDSCKGLYQKKLL